MAASVYTGAMPLHGAMAPQDCGRFGNSAYGVNQLRQREGGAFWEALEKSSRFCDEQCLRIESLDITDACSEGDAYSDGFDGAMLEDLDDPHRLQHLPEDQPLGDVPILPSNFSFAPGSVADSQQHAQQAALNPQWSAGNPAFSAATAQRYRNLDALNCSVRVPAGKVPISTRPAMMHERPPSTGGKQRSSFDPKTTSARHLTWQQSSVSRRVEGGAVKGWFAGALSFSKRMLRRAKRPLPGTASSEADSDSIMFPEAASLAQGEAVLNGPQQPHASESQVIHRSVRALKVANNGSLSPKSWGSMGSPNSEHSHSPTKSTESGSTAAQDCQPREWRGSVRLKVVKGGNAMSVPENGTLG